MIKTNKKRIIILVIVFLALIVGLTAAYLLLAPKPVEGSKTIQVEVILADESSKTHTIQTDAPYLRGALDERNLISGEESEFGLFVKTVDGVTANDGNQEWWCVTQNGEWLATGIDQTPITDGDHFEITLTIGYDF